MEYLIFGGRSLNLKANIQFQNRLNSFLKSNSNIVKNWISMLPPNIKINTLSKHTNIFDFNTDPNRKHPRVN